MDGETRVPRSWFGDESDKTVNPFRGENPKMLFVAMHLLSRVQHQGESGLPKYSARFSQRDVARFLRVSLPMVNRTLKICFEEGVFENIAKKERSRAEKTVIRLTNKWVKALELK